MKGWTDLKISEADHNKTIMPPDLRILQWNTNGLLQHQQELLVTLQTQKIDICLIAETHLTRQSFIKLQGYQIYHAIHPQNSARGGAAVAVKNSILHWEREKIETEEIQCASISVKTKKYTLNIAAAYFPPRHNLKREDYANFLSTLGEKYIIGADFNAKNTCWGSRLSTPKGKELQHVVTGHNCRWHSTGKPTYWPSDANRIPDLLDFFISRGVATNFIKVEDVEELISDHSPILLTISEQIVTTEMKPALTNKFTDWVNFQSEINEKIEFSGFIQTTEQLEQETDLFMINIQQAAWNNTPIIQRKTVGNNYPKEIRDLIQEKRKARKIWQRTRIKENKNKLNRLTQQLQREISKIKNESINKYLRELTDDECTDYSLWKAAKKINKPVQHIPPLRKENRTWARNPKEKVDAFADYLENIFQPNPGETHVDDEPVAFDSVNIQLTTTKEVQKLIKNINTKKAPGFDLINGEILKKLPRKAIVKLTTLINASFRLRYVPILWKTAEVIMIPKVGQDNHELTSYRPISLLSIISKVFEKLLLRRMNHIIEQKNIIPTHQFGFRDKHSTIDQIHRIVTEIEKALEGDKICSAVFLDIAKAFDKVWHDGLLMKLKKIFPMQLVEILKSYLHQRTFRVKMENEYSELKQINAGVPQGSVLGPILYLLYTSDIPERENIQLATFADDTAVMTIGATIEESTINLQNAINGIEGWSKKWRIKFNEQKSVHINFTNKKINNLPIILNNNVVPNKKTAKYLGLNLDVKLKWKEHVKKKTEQMKIKYKNMYWLIGRYSQLSIQNKVLIYQQILKPVWTYGLQLWGCTKKSNYRNLETLQNRILRNIVCAPWYVRNDDLRRDLKIESIPNEIKKVARRHEERLHKHPNHEALQLLVNEPQMRRLKRTKPFELV